MKQAIKITPSPSGQAHLVDASDKFAGEFTATIIEIAIRTKAPMATGLQSILIELVEVPDDTILYQPSADSGAMGGA